TGSVFYREGQTLEQFLEAKDKANQTAYEGQQGYVVQSSQVTTIAGLPAVQRVETGGGSGITYLVSYLKRINDPYQRNNIYSLSLLVRNKANYSPQDLA